MLLSMTVSVLLQVAKTKFLEQMPLALSLAALVESITRWESE
jgi:hypothetical protein